MPLAEKKNNEAWEKKGEAMARARAWGWLGLCYSKVMVPEKSWWSVNNVGAHVLVRGE
jgi:hypothetical protein